MAIRINNRDDHDCVFAEFVDDASKCMIHFHAYSRSRDTSSRELRQIVVTSKELGTVFAYDVVRGEREECDPLPDYSS